MFQAKLESAHILPLWAAANQKAGSNSCVLVRSDAQVPELSCRNSAASTSSRCAPMRKSKYRDPADTCDLQRSHHQVRNLLGHSQSCQTKNSCELALWCFKSSISNPGYVAACVKQPTQKAAAGTNQMLTVSTDASDVRWSVYRVTYSCSWHVA